MGPGVDATAFQARVGPRFRVERVLGQGGMGVVLEAVQIDLSRRVALKLLTDPDPQLLARFRQEALALAAITHPNVVRVFGLETTSDGAPMLVMELVVGVPLSRLLSEEGPLPPPRAAALATSILDALVAVHQAGIVHRDVKPANVIVTRTGCRLVDFGIAKQQASDVRTATGTILGTPAYIAPEQVFGGSIDGRADVYAVGVCLFEMLAGRRPWTGSGPEILVQRLEAPAPPLASFAPAAPAAFGAVVAQALARWPEDRFATALEMRAALAQASSRAADAPPSAPGGERRGLAFGLTVAATLLVGAAIAAAGWLATRKPVPPEPAAATSPPPPRASPAPPAPSGPPAPSTLDSIAADAGPPAPGARSATDPPRQLCRCREFRQDIFFTALCVDPTPPDCQCITPQHQRLCREPLVAGSACSDRGRAYPAVPVAENQKVPCDGYGEGNERLTGFIDCSYCTGAIQMRPGRHLEPCRGTTMDGAVMMGKWDCLARE